MMASRMYCGRMKTAFSVWRKPTCDISCVSFALHRNSFPITFSQDRLLPFGDSCSRNLHTSQTLDDTHKVNMPSLSPTMTEGTIVKWVKKEGEPIAAGDVLCEIQTDKAIVSMEYDDDGILAKIVVPENSADIKVGTLIALAVDEGDDWKAVKVPADSGVSAPPPAASKPAPAVVKTESTPSGSHGSDRLLGPAVKNYLKKYGLNSSQISASGPHGTITKGDVLQHVQTKNLQPVSLESSSQSTPAKPSKTFKSKGKSGPASFVDVEITNMRRTIAKRLLQSKSTIPHAYGIAQCNMNSLVAFRKRLASSGVKVSVNDLLIKCVANALAMNPAINCVWEGPQLKHQNSVDISVAVATPNGLITPIVWNVGSKDVCDISSAVKNLAAKAKNGKLQPHEFMGGTFSISNLGMFGITSFSAIINPPQCAILAVGGTSAELDETGNKLLTSKLMLSYDGSAIMEDEATKFLAILKNEIENVNEISTGVFSIQAKSDMLSEQASLSQ